MKKIIFALSFGIVCLLSPNQAIAQKQIQAKRVQGFNIPMDVSSRRPIVDVMIDGKGPYKFIFDTGSTTNVIDEKLYNELGLELIGEDALNTPGSDNKLMSKRVLGLKVGFANTNLIKDLEMNVVNLRAMLPVDGILGGLFFEDYLITMDFPGSNLFITIGELNKNDEGVIPFLQKPRVLNLNINVDGNIVEAHLDTGNPAFFSLPYDMKDKLKFKSDPVKRPDIRTPAASFKRWSAVLDGDIKVGDVVYKNPEVSLIEGFEFVNVGYTLVKDLQTTIDRKNNLIRFQKPAANSVVTKKVVLGDGTSNEFTGSYEGDRDVYIDNGEMVYKRVGAPMALKLVLIKDGLFEMKIPEGVRAPMEIPKVLFVKNENKEVNALELVYKDGRKDGPFKKIN